MIDKEYPIKCICLTRNFGHQAALTAGMKFTKSEFVAILDGDLQDPPEVINEFLEYAYKGFDIVYGVRKKGKNYSIRDLHMVYFIKFLQILVIFTSH